MTCGFFTFYTFKIFFIMMGGIFTFFKNNDGLGLFGRLGRKERFGMRKGNDSTHSSLRDARKAAGFSAAKDFAASIGMPAPTYARYEMAHDGPNTPMPIENAWKIADALDTTIDAIVGRGERPEGGKVQRFYDGLSSANKARMEQFMCYLDFLENFEGDSTPAFLR